MVFVTAALGLVSAGAGLYSSFQNDKNQKEAYEANLRQQNRARKQLRAGLRDNEIAKAEALAELDAADEILAQIEPDLLESLDEQSRIRIAARIRQEQEQNEMMNSRLMAQGLDSSTVSGTVTRGQNFGQAQSMSELSAGFAGRRTQVQLQARQLQASAVQRRAGVIQNFAAQRSGLQQNFAGFESGIQFQPAYDGTAEAVGNFAGALANAYAAFDSTSAPRTYGDEYGSAAGGWGSLRI